MRSYPCSVQCAVIHAAADALLIMQRNLRSHTVSAICDHMVSAICTLMASAICAHMVSAICAFMVSAICALIWPPQFAVIWSAQCALIRSAPLRFMLLSAHALLHSSAFALLYTSQRLCASRLKEAFGLAFTPQSASFPTAPCRCATSAANSSTIRRTRSHWHAGMSSIMDALKSI